MNTLLVTATIVFINTVIGLMIVSIGIQFKKEKGQITIKLPNSGYTATFTKYTVDDFMTLRSDTRMVWELIYEKMISNNAGIKTFDQFLDYTSANDFNACIEAIMGTNEPTFSFRLTGKDLFFIFIGMTVMSVFAIISII